MRKLSVFTAVLLCLCLLTAPLQAHAEGMKIFRIDSAEDLLELAENCRLDSYSTNLLVTLAADVDLSGVDFSGIPSFSGTFSGNGHNISGLTLCSNGSVQGLFRYVTEEALIENLHVQGIMSPGGSANFVGGIAGHNAGTLTGCSFTGIVSGSENVGGIAGINTLTGIIEQCSVQGTVNGSHFIGGIAGSNSGVIRQSSNYAKVNTTVEQNQIQLEDITLDAITGSESAATVTDIGGICGSGTGVVRKCDNYGSVGYPKIGYNIGGICGRFSGYVESCRNYAAIDGRKDIGGIVGQLEPSVSMLFEKDALQTLDGQMKTMSVLVDTTSSHVQSAAGDLKNQFASLEQQIGNAESALDTLLPDNNDVGLPDLDTILAAQNTLSGSMSAISKILNSAGASVQGSANVLLQDLNALSGQMDEIGQTLNTAQDHLGGTVQDVSDADTKNDTTAKIYDCLNQGAVSGDWNVGGIAGSVGLESDLDPEADLTLHGSVSADFDLTFRAVILSCGNQGPVSGSKQYIGGIAGWASLGLIRDCTGRSAVNAAAAEYVGGIAGMSEGYIRSCFVRSAVDGDSYVGGVAGTGATVTDCRCLVQLTGSENSGAVLGISKDRSTVSGNYYLSVGADPGAIDGISYTGHAQPLDAESFFALEGMPKDFGRVTVRFLFDDGSEKAVKRPYGFALGSAQIPELTPRAGYEAAWVGTSEFSDPLYFDTEFTAVYTAHRSVLSSDLLSPSGHPRMLAQGDFTDGQSLSLTMQTDADALCSWQISLPESSTPLTLRLLPPDPESGTNVILQLQRNGVWEDTAFTVDGSYLVFTPGEDFQALRLLPAPQDYTLWILAGAGVVCLAAVTVLLLVSRRKRKKAVQ